MTPSGSTITGQIATVSVDVGGQEISFESGKLAKQADGAVVVRSGDTMILATAVGRPDARPDADFFPLTVDVEEKMYAAGKIPGGFFKREGRATERATLTARMIDRPIRPLWPKGFRNEVQVICTVLSADLITPHDILCINGASAALVVSPLPFLGPVGAVRIGRLEGELTVNPSLEELEESSLDLVVVGTSDALTMIEAGADQIPEETLLEAFELAHAEIRKICEALEELREKVGKPKWVDVELTAELEAEHGDALRAAIGEHGLREAVGRDGRARRRGLSGHLDDVDRGRHRQADADPRRVRGHLREGSHRGHRSSATRAVPRGHPRADRRRAGHEGAPLRQARPAARADHGRARAAVPGRAGTRRG